MMKTHNLLKNVGRQEKSNQLITELSVGRHGRRSNLDAVDVLNVARNTTIKSSIQNRNERRAYEALEKKTAGTYKVLTKQRDPKFIARGNRDLLFQPRQIAQPKADFVQVHETDALRLVLSTNSGRAWSNILDAIDEWSGLLDGWDGEDAQPIADSVIQSANAFVEVAERYSIAEPVPYISPDGEIGFIWEAAAKASVSFSPLDRFSAFCPREGLAAVRIAGPLDISACSSSLFEGLRNLTVR